MKRIYPKQRYITIDNGVITHKTANGVEIKLTFDDFGFSIESPIAREGVVIDTGVLNDPGDPPVFNLITCDKTGKETFIRNLSRSWSQEIATTASDAP